MECFERTLEDSPSRSTGSQQLGTPHFYLRTQADGGFRNQSACSTTEIISVKAKPPFSSIDGPGRQRVCNVMALFSVSHASVYRRIKDGRLPPPDGNDPRPYWLNETLRPYLTSTAALSSKPVLGIRL